MAFGYTSVDHYQLRHEIVSGATSTVYAAFDRLHETDVLVHVLTDPLPADSSARKALIQEANDARALVHPNILQVFDAGEADGRLYVVTEAIDGDRLDRVLSIRKPPLALDAIVALMGELAAAVDYAHAEGFFHGRLSEETIWMAADGQHRVAFLSVAHAGDALPPPPPEQVHPFTPPEQLAQYLAAAPADIYALGAVCYYLTCGQLPFPADEFLALRQSILYELPASADVVNAAVPSGVAYALNRVLAKDPTIRYADATSFATRFCEGIRWVPSQSDQQVLRIGLASRPDVPVLSPVASSPRRRRIGSAMLLAALLVSTALIFLISNQFLAPENRAADASSGPTSTAPALLSGDAGDEISAVRKRATSSSTPTPPPASPATADAGTPFAGANAQPTTSPTSEAALASSAKQAATSRPAARPGGTAMQRSTEIRTNREIDGADGSQAVDVAMTASERAAAVTLTQTPTPRPSATATPTDAATATPRPTATPTVAPTATPTATPTAIPTATPTVAPTATPTPTAAATSSPTPVPTATEAVAAAQAATATQPPLVPTATPTLPLPPPGAAIRALEPLDSSLSGRRLFAWQPSGVSLAPNQYFELVFWPVEGDPMADGFGPVGSIKQSEVLVNVDQVADRLPQLERNRSYYWGVLLVELEPYRRIVHLGTGSEFVIPGGGDGDGGDDCPGCGGRS